MSASQNLQLEDIVTEANTPILPQDVEVGKCKSTGTEDSKCLRRAQSTLSEFSTAVPPEGLSRWELDEDTNSETDEHGGTRSRLITSTFAPEETLIIFDWDDTILPTTWLSDQGCTDNVALKRWHKKQLKHIAERAAQTLKSAKKVGQVAIITNAKAGWVELSCLRYLPTIRPVLQGVRIISARSKYESAAVATPAMWKRRAFEDEVKAFHELNGFVNIVSIGDAIYEQEALTAAADEIFMCHAKTIKLDERPSAARLANELDEIAACLHDLIHFDGDLQLNLLGESGKKHASLADKFRFWCKENQ